MPATRDPLRLNTEHSSQRVTRVNPHRQRSQYRNSVGAPQAHILRDLCAVVTARSGWPRRGQRCNTHRSHFAAPMHATQLLRDTTQERAIFPQATGANPLGRSFGSACRRRWPGVTRPNPRQHAFNTFYESAGDGESGRVDACECVECNPNTGFRRFHARHTRNES